MRRHEIISLLDRDAKDMPEIDKVIWDIQNGQYMIKELVETDRIMPKEYPLGINRDGVQLSPQQQSVINKVVTSVSGFWQTNLDISDSYYRDSIIRKALSIAKSPFKKADEYFIKRGYRYILKDEYKGYLLYNPIIVTTKPFTQDITRDIDSQIHFDQAKADFMLQYRKVKKIMEGYESYRKELEFFSKEPEYFNKVQEQIKKIRKDVDTCRKQKKEILKTITQLESELADLEEKHKEISKGVLKIGNFILDLQKAKGIKELEEQLESLNKTIAHLNGQLEQTTVEHSLQINNLKVMRNERKNHTQAREEIYRQIAEDGLVIPDKNGKTAPFNTPQFYNERSELYTRARIVIDEFEAECKKAGITMKCTEEVMDYYTFITKYERYERKELGTIIVSDSITTTEGIVCGYYGQRGLQILGDNNKASC